MLRYIAHACIDTACQRSAPNGKRDDRAHNLLPRQLVILLNGKVEILLRFRFHSWQRDREEEEAFAILPSLLIQQSFAVAFDDIALRFCVACARHMILIWFAYVGKATTVPIPMAIILFMRLRRFTKCVCARVRLCECVCVWIGHHSPGHGQIK